MDADTASPDEMGRALRGVGLNLLSRDVPGLAQSTAFAHTAKVSGDLFASDEAAAGMQAFLAREDAPWVPES